MRLARLILAVVRRAAAAQIQEGLQHRREFHREDELGGRAGTHLLQHLEILQAHRLVVHVGSHLVDAVEGGAEPLGAKDGGLPVALRFQNLRLTPSFSLQNGRLLFALGPVDGGLPLPLRTR